MPARQIEYAAPVSELGDAEIEEAVGQELGRMGVQGSLALVGKSLELVGDGAPIAIDIDVIVDQWPLLPPEMRQRKAEEMARRLHDAHVAARRAEGPRVGVSLDGSLDGASRTRILGAALAIFGVLGAVGVARFAVPRLTAPEEAPAAVTREDDGVRKERLARACDAVRARLYGGASFGPFALEGFVAELWLASRKGVALRDQAAITDLVVAGKLTAAADDKLAKITDGTVEITDGLDADSARRSPGWAATTLVFHDGYARAFLEEETRPRFVGLAERVAMASGADHGALYARCIHLPTHDVGAWFRGPDLAGATASMVYQMGVFAEAKVVDRGALGARGLPGGELDALRKAAGDVNDAVLPTVSAAGGSVALGPPASIVFPFTGPVRPLTATRNLVRKMGIGAQAGD
jgi:hypothetical protein